VGESKNIHPSIRPSVLYTLHMEIEQLLNYIFNSFRHSWVWKRPWSQADHAPPSGTEVNNVWSYTSTPPIRLHGVVFSWSTGI